MVGCLADKYTKKVTEPHRVTKHTLWQRPSGIQEWPSSWSLSDSPLTEILQAPFFPSCMTDDITAATAHDSF